MMVARFLSLAARRKLSTAQLQDSPSLPGTDGSFRPLASRSQKSSYQKAGVCAPRVV